MSRADEAGVGPVPLSVEGLLARLRNAFGAVQRGTGTSLREAAVIDDHGTAQERAAARALDTDQHWWEIPDALIAQHEAALSFMDLAGLRYHLPAYLSWLLRVGWGSPSGSGEAAVHALTPAHWGPGTGRPSLEEAFTAPQRASLAQVLRHVAEVLDRGDACSDAHRCLDEGWSRYG